MDFVFHRTVGARRFVGASQGVKQSGLADLRQTDRTKLRRLAERGTFDRATANAIIHTGVKNQDKIWEKILFVRELIMEIVFHEIGYTGIHESYLGGHKIVHPQISAAAESVDISVD